MQLRAILLAFVALTSKVDASTNPTVALPQVNILFNSSRVQEDGSFLIGNSGFVLRSSVTPGQNGPSTLMMKWLVHEDGLPTKTVPDSAFDTVLNRTNIAIKPGQLTVGVTYMFSIRVASIESALANEDDETSSVDFIRLKVSVTGEAGEVNVAAPDNTNGGFGGSTLFSLEANNFEAAELRETDAYRFAYVLDGVGTLHWLTFWGASTQSTKLPWITSLIRNPQVVAVARTITGDLVLSPPFRAELTPLTNPVLTRDAIRNAAPMSVKTEAHVADTISTLSILASDLVLPDYVTDPATLRVELVKVLEDVVGARAAISQGANLGLQFEFSRPLARMDHLEVAMQMVARYIVSDSMDSVLRVAVQDFTHLALGLSIELFQREIEDDIEDGLGASPEDYAFKLTKSTSNLFLSQVVDITESILESDRKDFSDGRPRDLFARCKLADWVDETWRLLVAATQFGTVAWQTPRSSTSDLFRIWSQRRPLVSFRDSRLATLSADGPSAPTVAIIDTSDEASEEGGGGELLVTQKPIVMVVREEYNLRTFVDECRGRRLLGNGEGEERLSSSSSSFSAFSEAPIYSSATTSEGAAFRKLTQGRKHSSVLTTPSYFSKQADLTQKVERTDDTHIRHLQDETSSASRNVISDVVSVYVLESTYPFGRILDLENMLTVVDLAVNSDITGVYLRNANLQVVCGTFDSVRIDFSDASCNSGVPKVEGSLGTINCACKQAGGTYAAWTIPVDPDLDIQDVSMFYILVLLAPLLGTMALLAYVGRTHDLQDREVLRKAVHNLLIEDRATRMTQVFAAWRDQTSALKRRRSMLGSAKEILDGSGTSLGAGVTMDDDDVSAGAGSDAEGRLPSWRDGGQGHRSISRSFFRKRSTLRRESYSRYSRASSVGSSMSSIAGRGRGRAGRGRRTRGAQEEANTTTTTPDRQNLLIWKTQSKSSLGDTWLLELFRRHSIFGLMFTYSPILGRPARCALLCSVPLVSLMLGSFFYDSNPLSGMHHVRMDVLGIAALGVLPAQLLSLLFVWIRVETRALYNVYAHMYRFINVRMLLALGNVLHNNEYAARVGWRDEALGVDYQLLRAQDACLSARLRCTALARIAKIAQDDEALQIAETARDKAEHRLRRAMALHMVGKIRSGYTEKSNAWLIVAPFLLFLVYLSSCLMVYFFTTVHRYSEEVLSSWTVSSLLGAVVALVVVDPLYVMLLAVMDVRRQARKKTAESLKVQSKLEGGVGLPGNGGLRNSTEMRSRTNSYRGSNNWNNESKGRHRASSSSSVQSAQSRRSGWRGWGALFSSSRQLDTDDEGSNNTLGQQRQTKRSESQASESSASGGGRGGWAWSRRSQRKSEAHKAALRVSNKEWDLV